MAGEVQDLSRAAAPPVDAGLHAAMQSLVVNEVAESIIGTLDAKNLCAVTVQRTLELLDAEGARLWLVDEPAGELFLGEGGAPDDAAPRLARGACVVGWVAMNRQPALVADVRSDRRFTGAADALAKKATRSLVAVPLFVGEDVCGVLEAVNPGHGGRFELKDLQALQWLAPHVAMALKNSRVTAELLRSREEIRRSNEVLEQRIADRTAQIGRAKREWERTFDAIREPLVLLEGYAIRRANIAVAQLARLDIRAVIGARCHKVLANRADPCLGCQGGNGSCEPGEVPLRGRTYRVSFFPMENGVTVAHYRDVTDARGLEERLRESQRMASVGQLAAGAAHEINNPLGFLISNLNTLGTYFDDIRKAFSRVSALQGLVRSGQEARALELLRGGELVPSGTVESLEDAPAILEESVAGGRRVHEIVRALKELAHESVSPRSAQDPFSILERALKRAGVPPDRVAVVGRADARVQAEPLQLEIAFANVLRNALQASEEDAPIQVSTEREKDSVAVRIDDQGYGMSPEVRARMFDPFFTTRGVGGGLGLGLTAAYGIIARHGGTIEVQSEPGCGTSVTLRLPLAE